MTIKGLDKERTLLLGIAFFLLLALYMGGRRTAELGLIAENQQDTSHQHAGFDIQAYLDSSMSGMGPSLSARIRSMSQALAKAGAGPARRQILIDLAEIWKDSAQNTLAFLWYSGEQAQLENSEKSLTFIAHAYLFELRGIPDPGLKSWMALQARSLYKAALALNPRNDSATVGMGSTYFFVTAEGGTPMEGILPIRQVAEKDSNNLFAQFMLGYGGLISGQYARSAERFERVLRQEPENKEAIFLMAEACERAGEKAKARYWYGVGRKKVSNPDVIRAIEKKIALLQ